jgi:hypothetical protein
MSKKNIYNRQNIMKDPIGINKNKDMKERIWEYLDRQQLLLLIDSLFFMITPKARIKFADYLWILYLKRYNQRSRSKYHDRAVLIGWYMKVDACTQRCCHQFIKDIIPERNIKKKTVGHSYIIYTCIQID